MRPVNLYIEMGIFLFAFLFSVCVGLAFLVQPAYAKEPILQVAQDDNPLAITNTLMGQSTTFSGDVRLTSVGGDISNLRFLATDLKSTQVISSNTGAIPITIINRSNINIPSGISLKNGQAQDVLVTVNNVTRPGDYTGTITFFPGSTGQNAMTIKLMLHVLVRPDVAPETTPMNIQVVHNQVPFDIGLANLFVSPLSESDTWIVELDNRSLVPVTITSMMAVLKGEKTGASVDPNSVQFPHTPFVLPANQLTAIQVKILHNNLPADHYQGSFRFTFENADIPVNVLIELSVRNGPFWALLTLILGIIFGRLALSMTTAQALKQLHLLPRYYKYSSDALVIHDDEARSSVNAKLQDVWSRIESIDVKDTEDAVAQSLTQIANSITFFKTLQDLENLVQETDIDISNTLKSKFQDARVKMEKDDYEGAKAVLDDINKVWQQNGNNKNETTIAKFQMRYSRMVDNLLTTNAKHRTKAKVPVDDQSSRAKQAWAFLQLGIRRVLAFLSGFSTASAELRFWLIRPLLGILLLILLVVLGLQTLYVNAGASFGVAVFYDYLGLFLWGLSSDIAQRSLQNLPVPNAPAPHAT